MGRGDAFNVPKGDGYKLEAFQRELENTDRDATTPIQPTTEAKPTQADLDALRRAGEKMQELIASAGTVEDELVEDFKKLRRDKRSI